MALAHSVTYNDGENDLYALVIKGSALDGNDLDLFIPETKEVVKGVPNRAKADYGPEGGGRTWHS